MNITITANNKLVRSDVILKTGQSTSKTSSNNTNSSAVTSTNGTLGTTGATGVTAVAGTANAAANTGVTNPSFADTLSAYQGRNIGGNIKSTDLKSLYTLEDSFQQASKEYGVSVNLLKAIAKKESEFNVNATSPSGAIGIMQLMPITAASMGVPDPRDPHQNIMGGAKYMSQLLSQYNGNTELALAAYKSGTGAVSAARGVPQSARSYVNTVMSYMNTNITVPDNKLYKYATATEDDIKNDINKMLAGTYNLTTRDDFLKAYTEALNAYDKKHEDDDDDDDDISEDQAAYNRVLSAANSSITQMMDVLRLQNS